jgi:soluble lytic murein transglycosylase-like protein
MRYLTAVAVAVIVAVTALVLQVANLPGERPEPLQVSAVTPQQIAYGVATEAAARVLVANGCSDTYASPAARAAVDAGIEATVVAGVIVVESSCHPLAESPVGALGLMQISPRTWKHSRRELLDPETNIRIGTKILVDYVRPHGLREGLHRYNGLGTDCTYCDAGYSAHVMYAANRR